MKINTLSAFRPLMVMATVIALVQLSGRAHAAPPLPFHTIEGVGGGAITPMAYLVNPEPAYEGALFGKPAAALTYVNIGQKNLDAFTVTETLGGRIEFGYAANRLGLGTLPSDIRDSTDVDIGRSDLWLHHFNVRLLAIKEDTCLGGFAMPAVTGGVHFKVNDGIRDIDQKLGGALSGIGLERENGVDFTLTATKTVPPEILGRPLILTAGMRASQGAQLGFLGFGDQYDVTFEGNVAFLPCDWLLVAYEFRQKSDPYGQITGLIGGEDNWHGFDVAVILGEHATLCAGYGIFGMCCNTEANNAWWLQLKYQF
jgi:hypothetical protein